MNQVKVLFFSLTYCFWILSHVSLQGRDCHKANLLNALINSINEGIPCGTLLKNGTDVPWCT